LFFFHYSKEFFFRLLKDNLPPLPWEVSKPTHGKRITLLPDIEVTNYFHRKNQIKNFFLGTNTKI